MNKDSKIKMLIALKQNKITRGKAKELLQLPDIPVFVSPNPNEKKIISLLNDLGLDYIEVRINYPLKD